MPDLTSRLRRTRAEQPVGPELVDIADAWQQIDAQLGQIDIPRLREAHRALDGLEAGRESLVDNVAQLRQRFTDQVSGRSTVARFRRQRAIGELQAEIEHATTGLAEVTERLAATKASLTGLPDRRELSRLLERRQDLDAQLAQVASIRVRRFRLEPQSYLTDALGPPPADSRSQARWERTAIAIEHHRLRWQITDPSNALGSGVGDRRTELSRSVLRAETERTFDGPPRQLQERPSCARVSSSLGDPPSARWLARSCAAIVPFGSATARTTSPVATSR